jgi:GNAT superfamily N-acetyltransferase
MTVNDIAAGLRLSTIEGWNQTESDWRFLIEDPDSICLAAVIDDKVIGTTTAIIYSNQLAWIGMVLVDQNYRGAGVARSLLTNILSRLHHLPSIKLDATAAGREVYQKLGFKDQYLVVRMHRPAITFTDTDDTHIHKIKRDEISRIISFDENVFGVARPRLINYIIDEADGKAWLTKSSEAVIGFCIVRRGSKYHHIAPVIAETTEDAKLLIGKALKELDKENVIIDVLMDKTDLIQWLTSIGFSKQRHFIRMYKDLNILGEKTNYHFSICGPEFG